MSYLSAYSIHIDGSLLIFTLAILQLCIIATNVAETLRNRRSRKAADRLIDQINNLRELRPKRDND